MERICAICGNKIEIDKNNTNKAISYKNKFYHYDCFCRLCDEKVAAPRTAKRWNEIKLHIDDLVKETTKEQEETVARDELYKWISSQYGLSCISKRLYIKFASIYDGTFKGLSYPILGQELLDEWKYYWDEISAVIRAKNLVYEAAINYSIAILLSKNAEYREMLKRKKLEEEVRKVRITSNDIDSATLSAMQRSSNKNTRGNRRAELFKEVMGDGN